MSHNFASNWDIMKQNIRIYGENWENVPIKYRYSARDNHCNARFKMSSPRQDSQIEINPASITIYGQQDETLCINMSWDHRIFPYIGFVSISGKTNNKTGQSEGFAYFRQLPSGSRGETKCIRVTSFLSMEADAPAFYRNTRRFTSCFLCHFEIKCTEYDRNVI